MLLLASPLPKGAETLADVAETAGKKYGVSPYLLLGICYAESNFGAALTPPGPSGTGDFIPRPCTPDRDKKMKENPLPGVTKETLKGGIPQRKIPGPVDAWVPKQVGWGCGLLQFDYEAHYEFCKSGAWKDPAKIFEQACRLLTTDRKNIALKLPGFAGPELDKAMIAAYNAGAPRVIRALQNKLPLDSVTFHPGYVDKICRKAEQLAGKANSWVTA